MHVSINILNIIGYARMTCLCIYIIIYFIPNVVHECVCVSAFEKSQ